LKGGSDPDFQYQIPMYNSETKKATMPHPTTDPFMTNTQKAYYNETQEQKKHYKDFIYNLRFVLPCKYCRINLINNLKEHPITNDDLKNRDTFSHYIYNLHNTINKMLNKKIKISYEEVRDKYEHFRARCNDTDNTNKNKMKKISLDKNMHKKGCTIPLTGVKSKCVLRIVPKEKKIERLD
jgi:hypothetical protein